MRAVCRGGFWFWLRLTTRFANLGRISKALLPSGVAVLNTALAQSFFCAEKYRILSLWQSLSQLFRWLALHFFAPVRRIRLRGAVPYERD
jgi:hypothetical protein